MNRFFAATALLLALFSTAARATAQELEGPGPLLPAQVPEPLKPWISWSLRGHESALCPRTNPSNNDGDDDDSQDHLCLWPSRLSLELDAHGGRFSQSARIYRDGFLPLPGGETAWPREVKVDGQLSPVVDRGGFPMLALKAGEHAVAGSFAWPSLPESLHIPQETGLVALSLRGASVPFPSRDADGALWLQREQEDEQGESRLDVKVWRMVSDEVPLQVDTRVQLEVSGKNREVVLGQALLDGFTPISLDSVLPARLEPDGRLRVQVRPGTFNIELIARHRGPVAELALPKEQAGPWSAEELWTFSARPALRIVEINGVPSVDPGQTTLPGEWRSLPAYRMRPGDSMHFLVRRRGDSDPAPDQLSLQRTLWLDFDGNGVTARDNLSGTLTRSDRLEMALPAELGRVRAEGKDQLITRLDASGAPGVELRQGILSLSAESREALRDGSLPAVGWSHEMHSLSAHLNLPPGWRLLHASGVDEISSTWLQSWSLLDLFLLLLASLAAGKLFGWPAGVAMLLALGLAIPEDAPKLLWLFPLAAEALFRVVPAGRLKTIVSIGRFLSLLVLLLVLIPFAVHHLRTNLYPALDRELELNELEYSRSALALAPMSLAEAPPPDAAPPAVFAQIQAQRAEALEARQERKKAAVAAADSMELNFGGGGIGARGNGLGMKMAHAKAPGDLAIQGSSSYQQTLDLSKIDPNAMAQTGPGLPEWNWRSIELSWSGPVEANARVRLWLLAPWMNLLLAILRVLLLAMLWLLLLGPKGGLRGLAAMYPKRGATAAALLFPIFFLLGPSTAKAGEIPTTEMLDELRTRLTAPEGCRGSCLASPHLSVEASASSLRLRMQIDAAGNLAAPLPGALGQWSPESVLLDGKPADLNRGEDGSLWISLTTGSHQIVLEGALPPRDEVQLGLPLKPKQVEAKLSGWTLDGIHDDGTAEESLQLVRVQKGNKKTERLEPGQLPPFVEVERALLLGMTWQVTTRVQRRSPAGSPITVEVPLLPGEQITSAEVRAQNGRAQVAFGPHTNEVSWTSNLPQTLKLTLTAADEPAIAEIWRLEIAPTWHVDAKGIPPIHQEPAAQRVPAYEPWPGEKLELSISRPAPVAGATLTVQSSKLYVQPGARTSDVQLLLALSTSRGGTTQLTLPEGAELQKILLDDVALPLRQEGTKVSFALAPGEHRARLEWREANGIQLLYKTPQPTLAAEVASASEGTPAVPLSSVNASIDVNLAPRWVLFAGGPRLGPAVLIWSFALVMLLVSFALSRIGTTPLKAHQWALLALGLTQVDAISAAVVAGFFLALGWRRTASPKIPGTRRFDLMQILLVIWTVVAAGILLESIERGLLGQPEMQVAGNGSTASLLKWFSDRSGPQLPGAWVLSLPIFVYRFAMLAWALWLARALMRWLPWSWESFSAGGLWRPFRRSRPAIIPPPAPIVTATAVVTTALTTEVPAK